MTDELTDLIDEDHPSLCKILAELILILYKQKEQWVTSQPADRQRDVSVLGQLQVAHVP